MGTITIAADATVFVDDMPNWRMLRGLFVEAENNFGISGASDVERVFPALRTDR